MHNSRAEKGRRPTSLLARVSAVYDLVLCALFMEPGGGGRGLERDFREFRDTFRRRSPASSAVREDVLLLVAVSPFVAPPRTIVDGVASSAPQQSKHSLAPSLLYNAHASTPSVAPGAS